MVVDGAAVRDPHVDAWRSREELRLRVPLPPVFHERHSVWTQERAAGPSLRGALPPVVTLVALLAATQYRANRVGPDGGFLLDVGGHVDTAVHVGVTWELLAGYPPQVPSPASP